MTSFVNVCDVKSAEKHYACLKILNNKTKMNNPWVTCVRKKEFQLEEINLSRQKQNYRFYLFDKSWYLPTKHVI